MMNKFDEVYSDVKLVLEEEEEPIALPAEEIEDIPVPGDEIEDVEEEDVIPEEEEVADEEDVIDDSEDEDSQVGVSDGDAE